MVARRLDEIVEESLQKRELSRRDFLKGMFLLTLSIGTGVGFAGCSSPSGFEPSSPQNTGYRLIYPDWTKPVPDDVIPPLIEAGKRSIYVQAPNDVGAVVIDNGKEVEIPAYFVDDTTPVVGFTTLNGYAWTIGDFDYSSKALKMIDMEYFGKDMAKFLDFVNNNMSTWGRIEILGVNDNKAYGNYTFIEQGGGKVASAVVVQDVKNPENYQFYAFHNKNKLDKMMIEMLSKFEGYKNYFEDFKFTHPEKWRNLPDIVAKCYISGSGYKWSCEEFKKIATW